MHIRIYLDILKRQLYKYNKIYQHTNLQFNIHPLLFYYVCMLQFVLKAIKAQRTHQAH